MTDQAQPTELEQLAEARFRAVAAYFPGFVALVDAEGRFLWVNRVAPGLSMDAVLSATVESFTAPEFRSPMRGAMQRVLQSGQDERIETRAYGDGEREDWYNTTIAPAGGGRLWMLTQLVTVAKRAQAELERSEQRLRAFLEQMPDYMVELDRERRIRYANRFHPSADPAAILGKRIEELAEPLLRDEIVGKLEQLFAGGEPVVWGSASSSDLGNYVNRAVLLPGDPPGALVVATDVSHQSRVAEQLRLSEERLERALLGANVGLWEFDIEAGSVSVNEWFSRHLGIVGSTYPRAAWLDLVHEDDRARMQAQMALHLAGATEAYECEYRARSPKNGEWLRIRNRARLVEGPAGRKVVAGSSIDVTELRAVEDRQRELERQLEHAQRLESIGLLAGGVAHDFNNLLSVITSGLELAEMDREEGGTGEEDLQEVMLAVRRAAELTQRLLAFGRRSPLKVEPLDVAVLVREVVAMARRVLPSTIDIKYETPRRALVVRGDRGQLEQVLLNLCVNARDAMVQGGTLTLLVQATAEDEVMISVGDEGHGIAQADLARVFEPFFTTKGAHAGSGLGLAVVHGIVQQHKGRVSVESKVGEGTTVIVRLPRAHEETGEMAVVKVDAPRGDERILVAEDEPLVRAMTCRVLKSAGFHVVEAKDGQEAVELFERFPTEFDMVLLDAVMPRMDGWNAYLRIRRTAPHIPVVFCSGYAASVLPSEQTPDLPVVLAKPFRSAALLSVVRSAIDTAKRPA